MSRYSTYFNRFYVDYICINDAFQRNNPTASVTQCKLAWKPPMHGYLKLNNDGSWKSQDKASGGGVYKGVMVPGSWVSLFMPLTLLQQNL